MSDPVHAAAIDAAMNKVWAKYYSDRAYRHDQEMNRLYGLKLRRTAESYYAEFLERLSVPAHRVTTELSAPASTGIGPTDAQ